MGLVATVATIGSMAYSIDKRNDAQEAQEEARDREQAMAETRNRRRRRQALAQTRIETARARSSQANAGVVGGSAQGGADAAMSDYAGSVGLQGRLQGLNQSRMDALGEASSAQATSQTFGEIASFSSQFAGLPEFGGGGGQQAQAQATEMSRAQTNPTSLAGVQEAYARDGIQSFAAPRGSIPPVRRMSGGRALGSVDGSGVTFRRTR